MSLERRRTGLCDEMVDEEGRVLCTFDVGKLDLDERVADALLRAHAAEFGHDSLETQKQAFRCLRKLVLALQELELHRSRPLPPSVASVVHDWLKRSGLKGSTAQSHQAIIITLLRWCHRNTSGIVAKQAAFIVPSFARQAPASRRKLTEAETRTVVAACYEEIAAVEARMARGVKLLDPDQSEPADAVLAGLMSDLLRIGEGFIPPQRVIHRSRLSLAARVQSVGGITAIRELLYLSPEAVFPFYLAVTVQTGGNPMPLRNADRRRFIKPHPIRTDLEYLDWDKSRAAHEQRVDFPVGKEWSAPNLVRRLLALNDGLRSRCAAADRDKVFVALGLRAAEPRVPCVQMLHNFLADFIARHGLPNFDFKDLRRTSARAHHVAGGTIEAARRRLNHRKSSTTARYSGPEDVACSNDRAVLRFQGELVRGRVGVQRTQEQVVDSAQPVLAPAETVFGFQCKDPVAGLDGRTPRGSVCLSFTRCSGCHGALVPVDDASIVAKILGAQGALENARARAMTEGWWPRYRALYEDTRRIIATEVLPLVAEPVLKVAKKLVKPHHIPHLE